MKKIVDSIGEVLINNYPSAIQYIQEVPEGFQRPSFFIKYITDTSERINKQVWEDIFTFKLVYFIELDRYDNPDKLTLMEEVQDLRNLFRSKGYLDIVNTDRAGRISNLNGEEVNGNIHLSMDIGITDSYEIIEDYELMGHINYNRNID